MSTVTMVLGESGTGKSASLRNLKPADTLLIQAVNKPLPFKSKDWKVFDRTKNPRGNIFQTDNAEHIVQILQTTRRNIIVIDDFQYIMANEYMRRATETGFAKFTDIGRNAWNLLTTAARLPADKRIYILSHTSTDEAGRTKAKTIGRLIDEKITLEGMVTIVLRTVVRDGGYYFATRNNGSDTTKTPMGLFADELIANDLNAVDNAIVDYYGSEDEAAAAAQNHPQYEQEDAFA